MKMSNDRFGDCDLTYYIENKDAGSNEIYEVLESYPENVYTSLDKTAAKSKNTPPPNEEPGPNIYYYADSTRNNKKLNSPTTKMGMICAIKLVVVFIAVAAFFATSLAVVLAFVEIYRLPSEVAILKSTPKQTLSIQALESTIGEQLSDIRNELNNTELNVGISFENISNRLSSQQSAIDQLSSTVNNILIAQVFATGHHFSSCSAIQQLLPFSSSDYYKILSSNGSAITAFCDMTRSCGDITGGWMRVAELNMRDTTTQCPDSHELMTYPLRTCTTVNSNTATCSSDMFSVDGVQYSKVCGRIRVYQVGTPVLFIAV